MSCGLQLVAWITAMTSMLYKVKSYAAVGWLLRTRRVPLGFTPYCSLTLHVLEQLRRMIHDNHRSIETIDVSRMWIGLSGNYFHDPQYSANAATLVENLGDRRWERPVGKAHREALLVGLHDDWIRVELKTVLRTRPRRAILRALDQAA
jgi:hypothetical protein